MVLGQLVRRDHDEERDQHIRHELGVEVTCPRERYIVSFLLLT